MKAAKGFTLIELLIVMVILAIITTLAVPGFGRLIEGNRLVSGSNLLISSAKFARTEAIKRGSAVTLSTSGLAGGWCVHDGDDSGSCAADQIRSFESPGRLTFSPNAAFDLVFDRRGFLASGVGPITVEPDNCASGEVDRLRTINISPVGRVEVSRGDCP